MNVADASVLIAHLDERNALYEPAVERLLAAAGETLAASTLTLAEVFVGAARCGRLYDAPAAIGALGDPGDPAGLRCARRSGDRARRNGPAGGPERRRERVLTFDDRLTKTARRALS